MTLPEYSARDAAIAAYIQWLETAERKLASRPTPRCPAPEPSTTKATKRKALLDMI